MTSIKVYDLEKQCGLEDKIKAAASIAFTAPVVNLDPEALGKFDLIKASADLGELVKAGIGDPDVYHVYSVLVSTIWNLNDDIFNKEEVWAARHTPINKPTNLNHDETQIVGGMVNSWPVDLDFNLISDATLPVDLPDEYHLLVSSVIYRQWADPALKARADKLIAEVSEGNKFVSMECLFRGFDYGIITPAGINHIVPRNESTAFLTQHLRSYGGTGKYQDHTLGRVLRKITFSGKGFVNTPANPGSITFDKNHIFSFANLQTDYKSLFSNYDGVTNDEEGELSSSSDTIKQETIMAENALNEQIKELKDSLATMKAENKELASKLSEANVSKYEATIDELTASIEKLQTQLGEAKDITEEGSKELESVKADLSEKAEALKKAEAGLHDAEEDKKRKERKEKMLKSGLSEEDAEAKCKTFAEMTDEQFDSLIETIVALKSTASETDSETDEEVDASEVVEEETSEAGTIASETDDDEPTKAQAEIQSWVEKFVMKTKQSK